MSFIGTALAGLGIGAAGNVINGLLSPVMTGVGNLISGGNWRQSGDQVAQNQFNSAEAKKNRDFQQAEAEKLRAFNSAEAQKSRNWQENLSNTAHQRAVADMQEAGLNPILSAGSPASTPGGATASGSMPGGSSASAAGSSNSAHSLQGLASVISSIASLTNNTNMDRSTTKQIYNSAGNLLRTIETFSRK